MLPMLTVSGGPGLVYLNGRLCGETGIAAMPLAPDGVQYLELRPFHPGAPGAVLRLSLLNGKLVEGVTGDAFAVQWPGGWIAMELRSEGQGPQVEPRMLSHVDMPGGRYLLVDEGDRASFGRDAEESIFLPVENPLTGFLRPHFFAGLCVAEGTTPQGSYVAILKASGAPEIVQCVTGENATLDAQGVLRAKESIGDLVGHALETVYTPDAQGRYTLQSREPTWLSSGPRWPASESETRKAFLDALHIGAWTEASGYLIRPEDVEALSQVIGDFDAVIPLPQDQGESPDWGVLKMDGPNLASVRRLSFTMAQKKSIQGNWKIDSIAEGV